MQTIKQKEIMTIEILSTFFVSVPAVHVVTRLSEI